MRKIIFIVLALLLLVACTPKQDASDNNVQDSQVNEDSQQDSSYAPLIASFIANKDANNIYYKFDQGGSNPSEYNIWISGDKMKIVLPPYKDFFKYYDTIFVNNADKKAVAYCYNMDNRLCREKQGPYDLNYADVSTKTPYMWLAEIPASAKVIGSEQVSKRDATVIEYSNTKMWVDDFYKVPVRVISSGVTWNYEIISSGKIPEKDVLPP